MLFWACKKSALDTPKETFPAPAKQKETGEAVIIKEDGAEASILFSYNGLGYLDSQLKVVILPIYDSLSYCTRGERDFLLLKAGFIGLTK
jgi:hypothetical protein